LLSSIDPMDIKAKLFLEGRTSTLKEEIEGNY
jgi:hypothetical protein